MAPAIIFLIITAAGYFGLEYIERDGVPALYLYVAGVLGLALIAADQASTRSSTVAMMRRLNGAVIEGISLLAIAPLIWIPFAAIFFAIFGNPFVSPVGWLLALPLIAIAAWAYPRITAAFGKWTKPLRRLFRLGVLGQGGSAQFAGFLDEWGAPHRDGALLLGQSMYCPFYDRKVGLRDDRGFLTIATTRAGKGRSAIIPNLLTYPGSALVIDPKGTNAAVTAARRGFGGGRVTAFLGQEVHILDPFHIVPGARRSVYNPLRMIDPESPTVVETIRLLADALVVPDSKGDTHWSESARQIIAGLIAHLVTTDASLNVTLSDLRDVLSLDNASFEELLDAMSENLEAGGLAAAAAGKIRQAGPNERGSFMTTVMRNTDWLDSEAMRSCFASGRCDFDLRDLKRRPMTVYVVLPPHLLEEHSRFMRLFVNLSISAMSEGKKPEHPVLFLLDEFYSLGTLSQMEKAAGLLSGYGMKLWPIIQNISQLKQLYPENWLTFIANTGAIQIFSVNDRETASEVVQVLGKAARNQDVGGRITRVINNLREGDELGRDVSRESGRQIILRSGDDPMLLARLNYDKAFPAHWYNPDPDHPERTAAQWFWSKLHDLKERLTLPYLRAEIAYTRFMGQHKEREKFERRAQNEEERQQDPDRWAYKQEFLDRNRAGKEDNTQEIKESRKRTAKRAGPKPKPKQAKRTRKTAKAGKRATAMEELESLIGLDAVKEEMKSLIDEIKRDALREEYGLPVNPVSRHLVFTGNPGTGKTTVARIVGEVYKELGLLKKGHLVEVSRKDLAGEHWSSGNKMTDAAIRKAMDGVLFIDEAYSLHLGHTTRHGDALGEEIITTLLAAMENHRDRLVVIAAGYGDDMDRFIAANAGLASRFKTFIEFPDYSAGELVEIFELIAADAGYQLTEEARERTEVLMAAIVRGKGKGFGNGRAARNQYEAAVRRQAKRLADIEKPTKDDLILLTAADIPEPADDTDGQHQIKGDGPRGSLKGTSHERPAIEG